MPDTGNAKDCLELPPTNFSIFTFKNLSWRTYLISFTVLYCFLFRFVCINLFLLIWFLQIWVAIYVYGTMINLLDCFQSTFSLKTRLVLISSSTIANHDVIITEMRWDEKKNKRLLAFYDQLVHFNKEIMQTYIVKVFESILNVSTVHLNGIWYLIWRYLSKPVLGGYPVLSRHYSIPQGCPLNTGLTVFLY